MLLSNDLMEAPHTAVTQDHTGMLNTPPTCKGKRREGRGRKKRGVKEGKGNGERREKWNSRESRGRDSPGLSAVVLVWVHVEMLHPGRMSEGENEAHPE